MQFEWDERKNRLNIEKHGIARSESWRVFERPLLIRMDDRKDYGEPRWIALGNLDGTVVVLVFTKRGETIRAISIRKGNKHERQIYQDRVKTASRGLGEAADDDRPGY